MLYKFKSCIRIPFYVRRNQTLNMSQLESLKFDNLALKRLPIDHISENIVRKVIGACFAKVSPTPVVNPRLVAHSPSALSLLDLELNDTNEREFVEYFSGNATLPGSETAAHCYCGHQFGVFSGQLGDGAVIYLGEVINSKNERWEIQLKGAGKTPFSRSSDGRKVLRSSIREFLCSEAMHFLGIPTSRAGTCIKSESIVSRDVFYNGRPVDEKCAIVLRIAPTFIRFGSFEIFTPLNPVTGKFGPSLGRTDILHTMLDYVIETFFPEIDQRPLSKVEKVEEFYKEVVLRTARLVAQWQSVGFCHGVLNTDNMSILGMTIDYGPFGFLDIYNPHHICNASDVSGRYSFNMQPEICKWNLEKLAEAIQRALPLRTARVILQLFDEEFKKTYLNKMRAKLGLIGTPSDEDKNLIDELLDTMEKTGADFTNTFLCLRLLDASSPGYLELTSPIVVEVLSSCCYSRDVLLRYYQPDFLPSQLETFKEVLAANPRLMNPSTAEGRAIRSVMIQLRKAESLERINENRKRYQDSQLWTSWFNKYRRRIEEDKKTFIGEHSDERNQLYNTKRQEVMQSNNPRFILRNYIAQEAIDKAENGDYSRVQELVKLLEDPYNFTKTLSEVRGSRETSNGYTRGSPISRKFRKEIARRQVLETIDLDRYSYRNRPLPEGVFDCPPDSAFDIKVT